MAAETAFPFGSELLLDGKPMRGTKRLPSLSIEQDGSAEIDMWCGSVRAQATVGSGTIAITPSARDNAQCDPERIAGDDDLLANGGAVATPSNSQAPPRCAFTCRRIDFAASGAPTAIAPSR